MNKESTNDPHTTDTTADGTELDGDYFVSDGYLVIDEDHPAKQWWRSVPLMLLIVIAVGGVLAGTMIWVGTQLRDDVKVVGTDGSISVDDNGNVDGIEATSDTVLNAPTGDDVASVIDADRLAVLTQPEVAADVAENVPGATAAQTRLGESEDGTLYTEVKVRTEDGACHTYRTTEGGETTHTVVAQAAECTSDVTAQDMTRAATNSLQEYVTGDLSNLLALVPQGDAYRAGDLADVANTAIANGEPVYGTYWTPGSVAYANEVSARFDPVTREVVVATIGGDDLCVVVEATYDGDAVTISGVDTREGPCEVEL